MKDFLKIPKSIFQIDELSLVEKLILARIASFDTFFESPTKTAEYFNISAISVRKARIKLENLGYIECVNECSKGKTYQITQSKAILGQFEDEPIKQPTKKEKTHTERNNGQLEQKETNIDTKEMKRKLMETIKQSKINKRTMTKRSYYGVR